MRTGRVADAVGAVFVVTVVLFAFRASGQTLPTGGGVSTALTVQADLLKAIDASHARVADEVTARTGAPLDLGGAKFPVGSTVFGHVTEAEPSRLVLVLDHIAVKKNAPVPATFSLRAVMMPHSPPQSTGDQISPRAEGGDRVAGLDPATVRSPTSSDMLRSPEAAVQDSAVTVFQGPRSVETGNGGVIGLPGVHLGGERRSQSRRATFQADKNQQLRLEKGLLVIFVVSQ